jgi:nitrogen regulatory protein P-II 2
VELRKRSSSTVKLVTAIIKPFKLDDVRQAVTDLGIQGVTVTEVQGFGRQRGHKELYRGAEYRIDFVPKTKVELAVEDSVCEQVVEAIANVARTGKVGDGKVFVFNLEQAIRIRTGEMGPEAI